MFATVQAVSEFKIQFRNCYKNTAVLECRKEIQGVSKEQANNIKTIRHKEDYESHLFTEYIFTTVLLCLWSVTAVNLLYHRYADPFPLCAFSQVQCWLETRVLKTEKTYFSYLYHSVALIFVDLTPVYLFLCWANKAQWYILCSLIVACHLHIYYFD